MQKQLSMICTLGSFWLACFAASRLPPPNTTLPAFCRLLAAAPAAVPFAAPD